MTSNLKANWLRLAESWLMVSRLQGPGRYGRWESSETGPRLMLNARSVLDR